MDINRRQFLEITATAAAFLSLGGISSAFLQNGMPYRVLGKTGLNVSLLTVGGWHIGRTALSEKEAIAIIREAIDQGVNFLDNAWHYNNGRSEENMGKALKDGYRQKVILMTKHHGRDPETAKQHLEESLRRLQTDVIDVWQFHEMMTLEEVKKVYSSGVLDYVQKVRDEGKIRFIGFTGHANPDVHLEMIKGGFDWDTIQMPVNILDQHYLSFTKKVLPVAVEKKMGIIAMKTLAGTPGVIPKNGVATAAECLRFAMSMPVSTVCSGMDTIAFLKENMETAKKFTPMNKEEIDSLVARALEPSKEGKLENYKETSI